jgi:hypothetical protein
MIDRVDRALRVAEVVTLAAACFVGIALALF